MKTIGLGTGLLVILVYCKKNVHALTLRCVCGVWGVWGDGDERMACDVIIQQVVSIHIHINTHYTLLLCMWSSSCVISQVKVLQLVEQQQQDDGDGGDGDGDGGSSGGTVDDGGAGVSSSRVCMCTC